MEVRAGPCYSDRTALWYTLCVRDQLRHFSAPAAQKGPRGPGILRLGSTRFDGGAKRGSAEDELIVWLSFGVLVSSWPGFWPGFGPVPLFGYYVTIPAHGRVLRAPNTAFLFWPLFGPWAALGRLGPSWGPLGAPLGPLGAPLGPSWARRSGRRGAVARRENGGFFFFFFFFFYGGVYSVYRSASSSALHSPSLKTAPLGRTVNSPHSTASNASVKMSMYSHDCSPP